ncbi:ribosomal protein S18 acetylase RimI-like enzyme [Pedobacter sp. UYEF25]
MNFIKSSYADISSISALYNSAAAYQREKGMPNWLGFDRRIIEDSIGEGCQWQIMIGAEIACVFTLAFNDPMIWGERDRDSAVYIHRIATNPSFRGNQFVQHILTWVSEYARTHMKDYVRLDTLSGNQQLHNYYLSCGLIFIGSVKLKETTSLPAHYQNGMFSLFEICLTNPVLSTV